MIVVTGWGSSIAQRFRARLPAEDFERGAPLEAPLRLDAERYLFCQGLIRPKAAVDQTDAEITESIRVNYSSIVRTCNAIFAANKAARICVIGSESGYRGSFDGVYASAKMTLHRYVETKALCPGQQLVAISPWIIADTRMTDARADKAALLERQLSHPKQRLLTPGEVAGMAIALLFGSDFVSGTVVRMHGGLR